MNVKKLIQKRFFMKTIQQIVLQTTKRSKKIRSHKNIQNQTNFMCDEKQKSTFNIKTTKHLWFKYK